MRLMQFQTNQFRTFTIFATLGLSSGAFANNFGSSGRDGQQGQSGRDGRNGQNVVITADGSDTTYDVSGDDGSDAGTGEDGYSATSCSHTSRPSYSLDGADGGSGGRGGNGGDGGNSGAITVYFEDIATLKTIAIRGTPGRGGRSGWGGRGGEGCRCSERSWTVPASGGGSEQTFTCTDGRRGSDAGGGSNGSNGGFGQIVLIKQLQPLREEVPAMNIDMSKMEAGAFTVSKNQWEIRRGAEMLFARGSDLADQYYFFKGRDEATVKFRWEASRPISDFARWQMLLRLEGTEPKVYFPNGLWMDSQWVEENGEKIFVIKAVVAGNEIGYIQLEDFVGEGAEHLISIKDSAGMANVLHNEINAEFWTVEAGQWKKQFHADVPSEALSVSADRIQIAMGQLGLNPDVMKVGTQAFVRLLVTRALGENSMRYQLSSNYTIKIKLSIGDAVEVARDSDMYHGNQVVGHVKKGEKFTISKIQGDWIGLKKLDGMELTGWIQRANLTKS